MSNEIAPIVINNTFGKNINLFDPETRKSVLAVCKEVIDSGLAPKWANGNPGKLMLASIYGFEVGLSFMQSMSGLCVINGLVSMYGDILLGFCLAQPDREYIEEYVKEGGIFGCVSKRIGRKDVVREYSIQEAKSKGMFQKEGPWSQFPLRMMQMRPRSWSLRDTWADKLRGIQMCEEVADFGKEYIDMIDMPKASILENQERLQFLIKYSGISDERVKKMLDWAQCNSVTDMHDDKAIIAINALSKEFPMAANEYVEWAIAKIQFISEEGVASV
jgi:hypothetical protein